MQDSNSSLHERIPHSKGLLAISPIVLFLFTYLVVSIIVGDFYKMPIAVALVVSSMWATLIYKGVPLARMSSAGWRNENDVCCMAGGVVRSSMT
jgi:hypothetical protein